MKKAVYVRCPRCELNYILKDEEYCSVCKQEMKVGGGEIDELDMEVCPICKTNYMMPHEIMCASCFEERANDPNYNGSDEWDEYANQDEMEEMDDAQEEIGDMSSVKMFGVDSDDDDDVLDLPDDDFDDLDDDAVEMDDEEEEFDDDLEDDDDDDFDDDDDDESVDDLLGFGRSSKIADIDDDDMN